MNFITMCIKIGNPLYNQSYIRQKFLRYTCPALIFVCDFKSCLSTYKKLHCLLFHKAMSSYFIDTLTLLLYTWKCDPLNFNVLPTSFLHSFFIRKENVSEQPVRHFCSKLYFRHLLQMMYRKIHFVSFQLRSKQSNRSFRRLGLTHIPNVE